MNKYGNDPVHTGNSGVGFFVLLTLVLIVLKLTGYVGWSWWLVLSPLIAGGALFLLVVSLYLALAMSNTK